MSGQCECGCGGTPKGATSRFLPGHDWRPVRRGAPAPRPAPVLAEPDTTPTEYERTLSMLGRLVFSGDLPAKEDGDD